MKSKSSLLIIFLVVFIDLLGFGIVIPILPYYATQYGASAMQLGWLMTIYSLMQFIFAPIWGRFSDSFGRRPILLLSILGTAMGFLILGNARSLLWLFIGRFVAGLFGANISTASAYIADITSEQDRAKGMGIIGASFGLGFIFGPAIGGILSKHGYSLPMFVAAAICLLNVTFAFFKLKEPELSEEDRASHRSKRPNGLAIKDTFNLREARNIIFLFFLCTLAFTQLEVVFALFMKARYALEAHQTGWLLAFMGIIMVVLQGGAIGKLSKFFGETTLIRTGSLCLATGLLLIVAIPDMRFALLGIALIAMGNGLNNPSLSSLVSKAAPSDRRGTVMGIYQSAGSLARMLGPLFAGWSYDRIALTAPLIMSAIFFGLVSVLTGFLLLVKKQEHSVL